MTVLPSLKFDQRRLAVTLAHGQTDEAVEQCRQNKQLIPLGIFLSAAHNLHQLMRALIQHRLVCGGDCEKPLSSSGMNAMHVAPWYGSLHVVRQLLDMRVGVNTPTVHGDTPLLMALFQHPIQPDRKHPHTALTISRLLIAAGADVNASNDVGIRPLHVAAENCNPDAIELLMSNGARVDAASDSGTTPLLYACKAGHVAIVNMLLRHGANPLLRDSDGDAAADVAQYYGNGHLLERLSAY